jgi:hypothetical protein
MEKFKRDRDGEIFQDDLTENDGPSGAELEEGAEQLHLDPNIDSQEDDELEPKFAEELKKSGHPSGN